MNDLPKRWLRRNVIMIASILGAGIIALGSILIYQEVTKINYSIPTVTFDAEDGVLELYDTKKVTFPVAEKENTWRIFYPNHKYIGANKKGYDFITWSVDGKNPIPNDYTFTKSTTLTPLYIKNRDCITFACRYFDDALEEGATDTVEVSTDQHSTSLVYSLNGSEFAPYDEAKEFSKVGDYISFKTTSDSYQSTSFDIWIYETSKTRLGLSGPIDALTNKKDFEENAFYQCFGNDGGALCSARGLTLCNHPMTSGCFGFMFYECNNLLYAPELPATTLADGCYTSMFGNCTSLIQAPSVIPAEEIPSTSCFHLFDNCRNLSEAPDLSHIKKIHENGCNSMFQGCASLTSAANFDPEIVGKSACESMFYECVSLTKAPKVLSANKRYNEEDGIEDGLPESCYFGMFKNCGSLTTAPEIKATNIADFDFPPFGDMFVGCSKLNSIKIHYVGDFAVTKFGNWVSGVADEGTFYYNGNDDTHGESAIPENWDIVKF